MQIYFSSKMQWGSLFEMLGWGMYKMIYKIKLRYRVFCSGRLIIETCPKVSCLAAQNRSCFLTAVVFQKKVKIMRKCRVFEGLSIDTTPDPPPLILKF